QQFQYISSLRHRFQRHGLPMISVDTKKRELVGNFKNAGAKWDRFPVPVNDHDFRSDSTGVAIPYGIYDLLANRGSVFLGVSHDTSAFAAHSIANWWKREGSLDRKSTRLNSSHLGISYAVFCLKKKKSTITINTLLHPSLCLLQ